MTQSNIDKIKGLLKDIPGIFGEEEMLELLGRAYCLAEKETIERVENWAKESMKNKVDEDNLIKFLDELRS